MKYIVFLVLGWAMLSCRENRESVKELKMYFDLDSLIDAQVGLLTRNHAILEKSAGMDGQQEAHTLHPDSAGWQDELSIVRDFNLNKPSYVGGYKQEGSGDQLQYILAGKLRSPVKYFQITKNNHQIRQIHSRYFEDKSIYQLQRDLELVFEDSHLKSYRISGYQKMILKDTVKYTLSGTIQIP